MCAPFSALLNLLDCFVISFLAMTEILAFMSPADLCLCYVYLPCSSSTLVIASVAWQSSELVLRVAHKYFHLFLFFKHHKINLSLGVPAMGCENPNVGVKTGKSWHVVYAIFTALTKNNLLIFRSGGFAEYSIRGTISNNCSQPPDHQMLGGFC